MCARNNTKLGPSPPTGVQLRGVEPGEEWQIEVIKAPLKDIIPRFGLPLTIQNDNGAALITKGT